MYVLATHYCNAA